MISRLIPSSRIAWLSILLGCAAHDPIENVGPISCEVPADSGVEPLRLVTIAVPQPFSLDSAPVPGTPAERLVMRQLYETLVRRDCNGRILPALASRWVSDHRGEYWTFTLKGDSTRWGAVTARVIKENWDHRRNGGLWPWPGILDVEVVSALTLKVRLAEPTHELPAVFADPRLAVARTRPAGRVPGETGSYRMGVVLFSSVGPMLKLWQLLPVEDTLPPRLRVEEVLAQADARDLLDAPEAGAFRPADIIITGDSAVLSYARARRDLRVVPLPWDRTYVTVSHHELPGLEGKNLDEVRQTLMRDVVHAEVRASVEPHVLSVDSSCTLAVAAGPSPQARVVYPVGDNIARALAERVAALAGSGGRPLRLTSLSPRDFESALASGDAVAFITTVPVNQSSSCRGVPRWPRDLLVTPLLDAHPSLIVRRGVPGFSMDADGAIRFASPSR